MPLAVVTHSGPFHADDVMAWALVRRFVEPAASLVRTRDPDVIAAADLVFDVGGIYDPIARRFDHHQQEYGGGLSSAGMVLSWLVDTGRVSAELAAHLRREGFDYLDAVDTGRVAPVPGVPCFPRIVDALVSLAQSQDAFDAAFGRAADVAETWLDGMVAQHLLAAEAREMVADAMARADAAQSNLLELPRYLAWKAAYFDLGGERHRTQLALFPGTDGTYRVVAIPPRFGDFGQKLPLPEAWGGLSDAALEAVVGVPGARFCHKNRFIAVFDTREHALAALRAWGLTP